jgi:hypothetical protein
MYIHLDVIMIYQSMSVEMSKSVYMKNVSENI